jgi:ABC-type Fe3+-hydroxamate transport system substrate-binding protein
MIPDAIDDGGVALRLARPPERIVSLVPSLTELVCALGCAPRLIAVTRYCTDPPEIVAGLVKVGGTKNPDCDAILALAPDLILVNAEENRRADYDRLAAAGVPLFNSFPKSVLAAALSIRRLGNVLGRAEEADDLASRIEAERAAALERISRRTRVFCPIWRNPWMTFNRDTFAHDLLWCAGADNVAADAADRYPRVELSDIAARRPEVVLLPDEPYRFAERHVATLGELSETPAWRDQRIHLVDGKAVSWYGPRTPAALADLSRLLFPLPHPAGEG